MFIQARPVLVETDRKSTFIMNPLSGYLYMNKPYVNNENKKYVDLFLTYAEQDFEEGEELHHRITKEVHKFVRWEGDMLITHYETEIGKGEDWTWKDLLQFDEQIIATSNRNWQYPIIPFNFIKNFLYHNNNEDSDSIKIVDVLAGEIGLYEDGMEHFCTYCHKSENECDCKEDFYIKTKYPSNNVILKQKNIWDDSDMIAFAKYAKNYYSSKKVEKAFENWKERDL